jgi:hypothetical protein
MTPRTLANLTTHYCRTCECNTVSLRGKCPECGTELTETVHHGNYYEIECQMQLKAIVTVVVEADSPDQARDEIAKHQRGALALDWKIIDGQAEHIIAAKIVKAGEPVPCCALAIRRRTTFVKANGKPENPRRRKQPIARTINT